MKASLSIRLASLAAALLLIASCAKQSTEEVPQEPPPRVGIVGVQGAPFFAPANGNVEDPAAVPEWKAALELGTKVTEIGYRRIQSHAIGGSSVELLPVELANPDTGTPTRGWIRASHFAEGSYTVAVVTAPKAVLRNGPGTDTPIIGELARGSLIALDFAGQDVGASIGALVYDAVNERFFNGAYLPKTTVSYQSGDLGAARLLLKAAAIKDEAERRALLEEAERAFPGSAFALDIGSALSGEAAAAAPGLVLEELAAGLLVRVEGARVYASPAPDAEVLATLPLDEEVRVVRRSAELFEREGQSARWYEAEAPQQGWIFGTDLEGAD